MTKARRKAVDDRVGRVYRTVGDGVQISIWDMGKVFAEGERAIAEGADDTALAARLTAFLETIRKN